jgi:hypothetical protein
MARKGKTRKASTRFGKKVVSFNLRMPEDLRSDLEEAAALNDHSMNAEILWRLHDHIATTKSMARIKADDPISMASFKTIQTMVETVLMERFPSTTLQMLSELSAKQFLSLAARLAEQTERDEGTAAVSVTASSTQSSAPSPDARSTKEPTS